MLALRLPSPHESPRKHALYHLLRLVGEGGCSIADHPCFSTTEGPKLSYMCCTNLHEPSIVGQISRAH